MGQTDGQTDRRIAVSLNAPLRRGHINRAKSGHKPSEHQPRGKVISPVDTGQNEKNKDGLLIQDGPKKRNHRLMTILLSNLNRFLKNHWKIPW